MVRIYKHYEFALASPHHALKRVSFSSYPGELSSDDDFYLMDTGLALLQTTNDILDTDLYRLLTPRSLLNWQRVRQASLSLKLSICSLSFTVLGVGFSLTACLFMQAGQCNGHQRARVGGFSIRVQLWDLQQSVHGGRSQPLSAWAGTAAGPPLGY